ncbi:Zn-dependent protease with chaperone function [Kibdelosporangium banguiense]|uniref:Zn-dependent protease with chaperone function n=1 Tax=Kibdelosporangium banguiense TaxID=1365924 RepID=A0ABS4TLY5_9PSEU|nr:M56 family metallopeptidase [Kibdelosporangium banguiense]MBP2325014.1 Zn-dependent protease with chaperone function [Kibdelosporangium banguiense]
MIAALALLVGAFAAGVVVPAVLRRADTARLDPVVLLVGWLLSIVGVLAAAAAGVALFLIPNHSPATNMLALLHKCWMSVAHGATPRIEEIIGLLAAVVFLAVVSRFPVIAIRTARRRKRIAQDHLAVLSLAARRDDGMLWLEHDRPLAFSLAGRPGVVVATEGLTRHLSPGEVRAVLAHEHAHLRGRHHLLITCVDALAAALPVVPLFRQAPAAVRVLVEMAADVAAIRACGHADVHAALVGVSADGAPSGALAMARDAVDVRLARLRSGTRPAGRVRQTLSCGLTAAAAVALPIWVGVWILVGVALVSCPVFG